MACTPKPQRRRIKKWEARRRARGVSRPTAWHTARIMNRHVEATLAFGRVGRVIRTRFVPALQGVGAAAQEAAGRIQLSVTAISDAGTRPTVPTSPIREDTP